MIGLHINYLIKSSTSTPNALSIFAIKFSIYTPSFYQKYIILSKEKRRFKTPFFLLIFKY